MEYYIQYFFILVVWVILWYIVRDFMNIEPKPYCPKVVSLKPMNQQEWLSEYNNKWSSYQKSRLKRYKCIEEWYFVDVGKVYKWYKKWDTLKILHEWRVSNFFVTQNIKRFKLLK